MNIRLQQRNRDQFVFDLDGEQVVFRMRINPRAKRLILRQELKENGMVIVVPHKDYIDDVPSFVMRHKEWILSRQLERKDLPSLGDGMEIPVRDALHKIQTRIDGRRGVWVEDGLPLPIICVSGSPEHSARRVRDWLKKQARKDLIASCQAHAQTLGLPLPKITVRDTYSRWGSCSHQDNLSFSWRLILAPSFVLDYVAAHESAHRIHMNHSRAFWDLAHRLSPCVDEAEHWLKTTGPHLFRYQ